MTTRPIGRHAVADIVDAEPGILNDADAIVRIMLRAATAVGATALFDYSYQFDPQGVTAFVVLSESHLSVHTYPEFGVAMVDAFTCGKPDAFEAARIIAADIGGNATYQVMNRGVAEVEP